MDDSGMAFRIEAARLVCQANSMRLRNYILSVYTVLKRLHVRKMQTRLTGPYSESKIICMC